MNRVRSPKQFVVYMLHPNPYSEEFLESHSTKNNLLISLKICSFSKKLVDIHYYRPYFFLFQSTHILESSQWIWISLHLRQ